MANCEIENQEINEKLKLKVNKWFQSMNITGGTQVKTY